MRIKRYGMDIFVTVRTSRNRDNFDSETVSDSDLTVESITDFGEFLCSLGDDDRLTASFRKWLLSGPSIPFGDWLHGQFDEEFRRVAEESV